MCLDTFAKEKMQNYQFEISIFWVPRLQVCSVSQVRKHGGKSGHSSHGHLKMRNLEVKFNFEMSHFKKIVITIIL